MSNPMPIQRKKAAERLAARLHKSGPVIAEKLAPRMAKVLEEGEEMPDVAHLLDVLGRMVKAEHKGLYDADDRRSHHGTEQWWLRKQLNEEAAPGLRGRVVEVRDWLRHNYGAKKAKWLLDFEGRTPRGIEELADLATIMVRRLPILKPKQGPGGDVLRQSPSPRRRAPGFEAREHYAHEVGGEASRFWACEVDNRANECRGPIRITHRSETPYARRLDPRHVPVHGP